MIASSDIVKSIAAHDRLAGVTHTPAFTLSAAHCLQVVATALLLLASVWGVAIGSDAVAGACCMLILVLGLPHGAIDIISLVRVNQSGGRRTRAFGLYVGAGSAMAVTWLVAPSLAFALFLIVAIAHFSEDWLETQSPFLAHGTALGLLVAPAALHPAAIMAHFSTLSGATSAILIRSVMTLATPVAMACTIVATAMLCKNGNREAAVAGTVSLIGLLLLPPVVGFALFFCLHHSPRHFSKALGPDGRYTLSKWGPDIALTTVAALGLAALFYALIDTPSISDGLIRASFMTLSVLTVPHMLLPRIVGS